MSINDATRYMMQQIQEDLYVGGPRHCRGLIKLLKKFDIKSAQGYMYGEPLQMESLDAILTKVAFNVDSLKVPKVK